MTRHLSIDIETYSDIDIRETGLYRYIEDESFQILLFSYSVDFGEVICIDLANGEKIPNEIIGMIISHDVVKHAYNAVFEMTALTKVLGEHVICPADWVDTMVLGLYGGLPAGLDAIGQALGLAADKSKDASGKALINYFSKPCKPTKANGGRTRNLPKHAPEKWELYKSYNRQDVVTEMEVYKHVADVEVTESERKLYLLDYAINAAGVRIDIQMVNQIIRDDSANRERMTRRARELTHLDNPNSPTKLLSWLQMNKCSLTNLQSATVTEKLKKLPDGPAKEMLQIRQALSKTSISKFYTMAESVCNDCRIRGLLQYYGTHTGRWAGRLVQIHNLKRNNLEALDECRALAKAGDTDALELFWGDLADTHSQLCRTVFVPSKGRKFVVADFNAIEARVLAWLAGESWVISTFNQGRDIYCETASQMFGVPVDKHGPNAHLRQKGKIAVLALGYGGGVSALKAMGGDSMGLSENEMQEIVNKYRKANAHIKKFWNDIDSAAQAVIRLKAQKTVGRVTLKFETMADGRDVLTIRLPSQRKLYYVSPHLTTNRFGSKAVAFESVNGTTHQWGEEETYGGKLTENIVQAVARDCLGDVMLRIAQSRKVQIVMHVHDEVILDADEDITLEQICRLMGQPISWAPGLPLKAAGFEGYFYKKD